ncbi:MAG TPA: sulfite oxidase [Blastocatellia bacterium]|jgi:DMSO/TMAO reductase YedYZ molybdopterin-dependent catalytic subunit|nr:sulfite oxidase [Blastocatellia bacterium]
MKRIDRQSITNTQAPVAARAGRRSFLSMMAAGPVALLTGRSRGLASAQQPPITSPDSPYSRAFDFSSLDGWITPNSEFFVRSHFGIPSLGVSPWAVAVSGAVERPRAFTADDLMKLPVREEVVTLECAGNLVGWGGVSNARWAGASLAALLKASGIRADATEVILVGADGGPEREAGGVQVDAYARSIPVAKALDPDTLVAFKMNGEPLPPAHGGPLRAVIPGWYGMDSVKWLKQVVVAREPFTGFYQARRYYEARRVGGAVERGPLGAMRLKSQMARPINKATLPVAPVKVFGAAWCGDAEIAKVELSFDGGRSWKGAKLGPDRAPFAWRIWSYDWTPMAAGSFQIIARAHDTRGRAQPLERDPRIITPYANNWADRRTVEVR